MKHVDLLIKPASGLCNMRCRYCFYHDLMKAQIQPQTVMTPETMRLVIRRAFDEAEEAVSFSFQGGEPTVAGLDFFREFVREVHTYADRNIQVQYAIQTNGLALDEAWAEFLRDHGFLVGISIDGAAASHDRYRIDAAGNGTYARVSAARKLLHRYGVDYNILCVVTADAARHPRRLYGELKATGCRYLQFIPCLDPLEAERGQEPYSLTPELYGQFLVQLFDLWYADWKAGRYVSIRLFDDYVHIAAGMPGGTCAASGRCGGYLVVESDGSVYPCDFYVTEQHRLGSLAEQSVRELMNGEQNTAFLRTSAAFTSTCTGCRYFPVCHGGCRRDRLPTGENYLCPALKTFFDAALPRLMEMARAERAAAGRR